MTAAHSTTDLPQLKPQEIPLDDPRSDCFFQPGPKPFLATPAALELYGNDVVVRCLRQLQDLAKNHDGLDYLQVFTDPLKAEPLWFIEDGDGGAITALLPSDY
jgi:hypothetical protein